MEEKIVTFKLGNEFFAFNIMDVVEIVRVKEITEIPTAPEFIKGAINLRGKIIPVIDLRRRFKIEEKDIDKKTKIIITEVSEKQLAGMIVDEVDKVLPLKENEKLPPPPTLISAGSKFLSAIIKVNDENIIILLDPKKIFSDEEQKELEKISENEGGEIEEGFNS